MSTAEKVLVTLSNPLRVTDEIHFSHRLGARKIVLSAGIHRQTWIAGYPIFVDLQLDNQSGKTIQKVELQLEKVTTYNALPAPTTNQGAVLGSLRIPDGVQRELVLRKDVSEGLKAILPLYQDFRTCQMELPWGLV